MERAAGSVFCPGCGESVSADVEFCPHCGARAQCPECAGAVMRKSRFFHWCDEFLLETGRPIRAAGIGRRANGWLIEWFLWFVVITLPAVINAAAGTPELLVGVVPLAWLIFHLVLWARGLTPGKLILGDRVIDTRGVPAGFWRMALRETIGKFISGIVFGVGFYWILSDKDQQGWHDKIAGTLVVTER